MALKFNRMFLNKIVIVLIFIIAGNEIIAQNQVNRNSGNITYSVSTEAFYNDLVKENERDPNDFLINITKKLTKIAAHFECRLDFNNKMSQFYLMEGMALDQDEKLLLMARRLVLKGTYLTNLHTGIQFLQEFNQKNSYIESSINNVDWKLTKEIKKIGDFVCYKATAYRQ